MQSTYEPKIVALVCNWCTYTGADLAGTSRTLYAPNVRIIKLPCTGRVSPMFVIKALAQGADGVLVSGCHPGDCHYTAGNYHARRKFTVLRELLLFLGIEPERVQFSWVSAAEGKKWAEVVNAVVEDVRTLGPRGSEQSAVSSGQSAVSSGPSPVPGLPSPVAYEAQTWELRAKARELLESGAVKAVIGYQKGSLPGLTRAVFAATPEQAGQLVWNADCRQNLSVYLTRDAVKKLGKVALVVKACDARSVVGLIQENQVARDDVVLLGMACQGVRADGAPAPRCAGCDGHSFPLVDHLIGAPEGDVAGADPRLAELARLEQMAPADRWRFWQVQFEGCLRCYACRAACPLCFCERCLADKTQPAWIPGSIDGRGNLTWHAARALHLAGRCVDCGACVAACPANIRLDLLNLKLAQVVREAFDYVPGMDPDAKPALTAFREEDGQAFIR